MRFIPVLLLSFAVWLWAGSAYAACSNPTAEAGSMIFNADHKVVQWCDGDIWYSVGSGGDTLSSLTCADGEVAAWNNTASEWECSASAGGADNLGNHQATTNLHLYSVSGAAAPLSLGGGGGGGDTTPDAFSFTDQTDVNISTQITSNSVTINGLGSIAVASVSGDGSPQIRIGGGSWVTSGLIGNGQGIEVRLTSSSSPATANVATVDIGGVTDDWSVTTVACSGQVVGGYCWYHAPTLQGCDTACSTHGGCNLTGLQWGNANATNCNAVQDALSVGGGPGMNTQGNDYGCFNYLGTSRYTSSSSTCAGYHTSNSGYRRMCACNG